MAMSDSSFELIFQELLYQKEYTENLEAENCELRQQLADLRAGRGIFIEILGQRFALLNEAADIPSYTASAVSTLPTVPAVPAVPAVPPTPTPLEEGVESEAVLPQEPAGIFEEMVAEKLELARPAPQTPLPIRDFLLEDDGPISSSSFLEEMQPTDEFSFEITNKLAIWREAATSPTPAPASRQDAKQQPQSSAGINEDEKAALRRELIGSFLLE